MLPPGRIDIDNPDVFLRWVGEGPSRLRLDDVELLQVWGLVGLAVLARAQPPVIQIDTGGHAPATGFARALGIEDVIAGRAAIGAAKPGRTVKLTRLDRSRGTSPYEVAGEVAQLLIPDDTDEATRHTIYYVLAELLRNVMQHSRDPLGAIAAAQLMTAGRGAYTRDTVQVAVGDAGIGIPAALRHFHPEHSEPEAALVRALDPHVSGVFEPGLSGTDENAGLGLFFIAEMAKHAAGRLLIATRGARLLLEGARPGHPQRFDVSPVGFPGTLVAFELPDRGVSDNQALIKKINELARQRTPKRVTDRWLRYESPPEGTHRFMVAIAVEDTTAARAYSENHIEPRLLRREPVALDFANIPICTQSFLHALLYEALRLAWAKRVPIYVLGVKATVRSSLDLLESYALGG